MRTFIFMVCCTSVLMWASVACSSGRDVYEDATETEDVITISMEDALAIAYQHAGVEASNVAQLSCKLQTGDPSYYKIEFSVAPMDYEYKIHAVTGVILEIEQTTQAVDSNNHEDDENTEEGVYPGTPAS